MPTYLSQPITAARRTPIPRYGVTRAGYSKRSGAPTSYEIKIGGEKRWRRVMVWQFSNAGTLFVRLRGVPHIVNEYDIADVARRREFQGRAGAWFARGKRDRRRLRRSRRR